MLRNVAVLVTDGVGPFELGVLGEVFGVDRSDSGLPALDFAICAVRPGRIRTSIGFDVVVDHGLERVAEADLVAVPSLALDGAASPPLLAALRAAVDRGARVLSVCSGAFALGAAGLLDGRRCTTHWMHAAELAARFPAAEVDPGVLYVDTDPIITSAGTAAGIDACLHLLRKEFGAAVASAVARRMVVPPHRDGGQAQYIEAPVRATATQTLEPLLKWLIENLDAEVTIEQLAARTHMSPRTFARRFRAETGTTPHQWLIGQRLLLAQRLLEETDSTMESIAALCGFGTPANLRHHFMRCLGTTPQAYRGTFRLRSA